MLLLLHTKEIPVKASGDVRASVRRIFEFGNRGSLQLGIHRQKSKTTRSQLFWFSRRVVAGAGDGVFPSFAVMEEPYEKELYDRFKSFDSDENDKLDQKSVNALCETLQLDYSQRKQLWSFLDHDATVSFEQFRNALVYLANNGLKDETYNVRDISPGKNTHIQFFGGFAFFFQ